MVATSNQILSDDLLKHCMDRAAGYDRDNKFFTEDFEEIKPILDALREGHTIALINIKPLKDKDIVELKRAINKLKKTTDAIEGELAGFGEDYVVATPSFATIHRTAETKDVQQ